MPFANYTLILLGKIIEVSLSTLRIVLISKGERKIAAILAFFEISLWLTIVSKVLSNLSNDPLSAVVYAIGFVVGNYLGVKLEDFIGLGTAQFQIIVSKEDSEIITDLIFSEGFAYTMVEAKGRFKERAIIYSLLPRKAGKKLSEDIKSLDIDALVSAHETKPHTHAFGLKRVDKGRSKFYKLGLPR